MQTNVALAGMIKLGKPLNLPEENFIYPFALQVYREMKRLLQDGKPITENILKLAKANDDIRVLRHNFCAGCAHVLCRKGGE